MKKKRLQNAPLVYVQAQFSFTDLPSAKLGSEQELENLHAAMMEVGLADRIDSKVVEMGFHLNQDASKDGYFEVKQEKNDMVRLIFRGFGNRRSVELIRNRLIIKVTDYTCYEEFKEFAAQILQIAESSLLTLGKVLTKQISIRYVDVILPSQTHNLSDYIKPALLPFHPNFANQTVGMSQSVSVTGENQVMVLVMEEAQPTQSGFPGRWLPADLMEPDTRASLILMPAIDSYCQGKNYGILSIDHQIDVPNTTQKWNRDLMLQQLDSLYDLSSSTFWQAITEKAEIEWGVIDE
ncbi:MAG: TIGR04255 family protein [Methylomonas sp.]|nr:TIGR04255 family protein [Methylomonas sp.]